MSEQVFVNEVIYTNEKGVQQKTKVSNFCTIELTVQNGKVVNCKEIINKKME
ncbi:hypothetical protein [Vagococcus fluvialis]|uniref:hypothetical protein n=1 Tax=Vagococcus fluvialis TaxID=2738 RepID=UPI0037B8C881